MDATALTITITAGGVLAMAGVWIAARARARRQAIDQEARGRDGEAATPSEPRGQREIPPEPDET
jgi:hypothetical protein